MSNDDGLQNAAILMMSLGEAEASEVFKHLSPKEVQKLGEAIAKTSQITREKVDEVVDKFTGIAASQSLLVSNSGDYVRSVLKLALGDDKAALLIDRILQGGDVSGNLRTHMLKHQQQMQAKSMQAMQQQGGLPGTPGGAGPGVAGAPGGGGSPQPGAQPAGPRLMKQAPGAINPDQMARAGAVTMPRKM